MQMNEFTFAVDPTTGAVDEMEDNDDQRNNGGCFNAEPTADLQAMLRISPVFSFYLCR